MKWYLLSIGLFSFIIYTSKKPGFKIHGIQNIVYSVSTKAADNKTIHRKDADEQINKSDLKRFSKAASAYTISANYKSEILCSWFDGDRIIFPMYNGPGLNKNILNERQPGGYPLNEVFYPAMRQ